MPHSVAAAGTATPRGSGVAQAEQLATQIERGSERGGWPPGRVTGGSPTGRAVSAAAPSAATASPAASRYAMENASLALTGSRSCWCPTASRRSDLDDVDGAGAAEGLGDLPTARLKKLLRVGHECTVLSDPLCTSVAYLPMLARQLTLPDEPLRLADGTVPTTGRLFGTSTLAISWRNVSRVMDWFKM